jgi:epoxyqueuosine reductase
MDYLKRRDDAGRFLRGNVRVAFPWARSIVVCALNYDSQLPLSIDPAAPGQGWIGRYAWSGKRPPDAEETAAATAPLPATDYHDELLERLRAVEARLRGLVEDGTAAHEAIQTRCYVDTGPLVERGFAAKAGVGWIGKNTCVINQELGSWLLLGVIVTSLSVGDQDPRLELDAAPLGGMVAPDRCGSCTRCIEACPTEALVAPREMDASRCIAYLTIEKKGEIALEFREAMGRQVFGCDICQDVCPWNEKNRRHRSGGNRAGESAVTPGMEPRPELVNPPLRWLAEMDAKEFKQWFRGSPLERTGRRRLQRNVAIAMGNSGHLEFLPQLRAWTQAEDAVLAEAARWAIEQIGDPAHGNRLDATA